MNCGFCLDSIGAEVVVTEIQENAAKSFKAQDIRQASIMSGELSCYQYKYAIPLKNV